LRAESDCLTCNLAAAEGRMKWPRRAQPEREQQNGRSSHERRIPSYLVRGGCENRGHGAVTSFEEWRASASAWPLKRLIAIWNDLPGVLPIRKFTSREIAPERIWRFLHPPEPATCRCS
jgi:hypothetical protein